MTETTTPRRGTSAQKEKKLQAFKLLRGGHFDQNGPKGGYNPGDIIESDQDLVALFGSEKFAKVDSAAIPA